MISSRNTLSNTSMPYELEKTLKSLEGHQHVSWFKERVDALIRKPSSRDFYITYTLIRQKFGNPSVSFKDHSDQNVFLREYGMTLEEAFRLLLLYEVLKKSSAYYHHAVKKLIEVADKDELITFLKYLDLLPEAEQFCDVAVEALRTNIAPVFDAIALRNAYPQKYFNTRQWNQMYLKAAFMQRPLLEIVGVEERANPELSRIISDYAHERWAASRSIDPEIWRPVAVCPVAATITDMEYLLAEGTPEEVHAAALVCMRSDDPQLEELIRSRKDLKALIMDGTLNWNNLKL